jgi:hypothetical protein
MRHIFLVLIFLMGVIIVPDVLARCCLHTDGSAITLPIFFIDLHIYILDDLWWLSSTARLLGFAVQMKVGKTKAVGGVESYIFTFSWGEQH